jgi:hypothetical protein
MNPDYTGSTTRWARDSKQAVSFLCKGKPDKNGYASTKKGARIKIINVEEI